MSNKNPKPETSKGEETSQENLSKAEIERIKSRKRSRESRKRKKIYIEELERKVEYLKTENTRLQNLLIRYKNESSSTIGKESKCLLECMDDKKKYLKETLIDPKTNKYKEGAGKDMRTIYEVDYMQDLRGKHNVFLDDWFETMINNIYPGIKYYYWKFLDEGYDPSFDLIKKYHKLRKYEKADF